MGTYGLTYSFMTPEGALLWIVSCDFFPMCFFALCAAIWSQTGVSVRVTVLRFLRFFWCFLGAAFGYSLTFSTKNCGLDDGKSHYECTVVTNGALVQFGCT